MSEADNDADLIELEEKIGVVANGLREALARFDASGGAGHAPGCACEVCGAIGELRGVVMGLEYGLSELARCRQAEH
jgi:hypothetical protein